MIVDLQMVVLKKFQLVLYTIHAQHLAFITMHVRGKVKGAWAPAPLPFMMPKVPPRNDVIVNLN